MSRKDKMNEESECIEAIFLNYINNRSLKKIFLFFEGQDDFKYYWPRISYNFAKNEYIKYDCQGKKM